MIIKLIPIKNKSGAVGRVVNYIADDKGRIADYQTQGVFQNLIKTDLADIEQSFEQNYADYAIQRSDGNIGMHAILSLSPLDKDKATPEMMDDLVQTYLDRAYPDALAFGAHHRDQDHWHSHVLVSGNKLMSREGTRYSREELKAINGFMQEYIRDKYPELEHSKIDMDRWGQKQHSEKAYWAEKRNPDLTLDKEQLAEQVQQVFRGSSTSKGFYEKLEQSGYQTYTYKGETKGVFWDDNGTSKKMRFSRLGIKDEMRGALDKQQERLNELEALRNPDMEQAQELEQTAPDEIAVEEDMAMEADNAQEEEQQVQDDMDEQQAQLEQQQIQELDMEP